MVELVVALAEALIPDVLGKIVLVGKLTPEDRATLYAREDIEVRGKIERGEMPRVFQEADIFMNLEVNPPCPNSILEALASGLPVAAFDTGAARELVGDDAGILVPYGGDPWELGVPNVPGMVSGVSELAQRLEHASLAARERAIEKFSVDRMLKEYTNTLQHVCSQPK